MYQTIHCRRHRPLYQTALTHFSECKLTFTLANVNSRSRSLYAVVRPSVCNVRAPYSGGCNFRQYLYGIWYAGHPIGFCTDTVYELIGPSQSVTYAHDTRSRNRRQKTGVGFWRVCHTIWCRIFLAPDSGVG